MERNITHNGFQNVVRHELRFGHGLEHEELERAREIFTKGLEHIGTDKLTPKNYEKFVKFTDEHPEGKQLAKSLSERDLERLHTALKNKLGIKETTAE